MWYQFKSLFDRPAASGVVLFLAAVAAMFLANSPWGSLYDAFLYTPVAFQFGDFALAKPLFLWINDGLMAVFFFHVGLELKREVLEGELSQPSKIALPAIGALGGMVVPALVYAFLNREDPTALAGWAIPAATDIAFALAILSLLGKNVPVALKIFLTSLAIFDDIGAIIIIALFYSAQISSTALTVAAACFAILFAMNRMKVMEKSPYLLVGLVLWVAVLKSGVHATLAGVVLAFFIPAGNTHHSPMKELEHDLHKMVAFAILPLFGFANAGLDLGGVNAAAVLHPVPLGIILGLFLGKQLGVFAFCWVGVKLGLAKLPEAMNWKLLYGVALLCGIGFTMSLFIASLAFEGSGADMIFQDKLGIIIGSLLSGTFGYLYLKKALRG